MSQSFASTSRRSWKATATWWWVKPHEVDDALAMIRELEPDLALLDVKMPGIDGIEIAKTLKGSNTVVVLLTAFSQRTLIESARDAGVVAYLVKPFRSSELLAQTGRDSESGVE